MAIGDIKGNYTGDVLVGLRVNDPNGNPINNLLYDYKEERAYISNYITDTETWDENFEEKIYTGYGAWIEASKVETGDYTISGVDYMGKMLEFYTYTFKGYSAQLNSPLSAQLNSPPA